MIIITKKAKYSAEQNKMVLETGNILHDEYFIVSAREVMFLSALVSLFVSRISGLRKNYSTDVHRIRWKAARGAGAWTAEVNVRCW